MAGLACLVFTLHAAGLLSGLPLAATPRRCKR
jgi:hypothetical protein